MVNAFFCFGGGAENKGDCQSVSFISLLSFSTLVMDAPSNT